MSNADAPKMFGAPVHAVGESDTYAMARTDMPFMHSVKPGEYVAEKAGQFYQVRVESGTTYLFGMYDTFFKGDPVLHTLAVTANPELGLIERSRHYQYYSFTGNVSTPAAWFLFVGDNYVLRYVTDFANPADPDIHSWVVLDRMPNPGRQYLASEEGAAKHSISYIDSSVLTGGFNTLNRQPGFSATGFIDEKLGYGFIYSDIHYWNADDPFKSKAPVVWFATTRGLTMTQVAVPFYPDRDHFANRIQSIGKGQARALMAVTDLALHGGTTRNQLAPPWMNVSNNYGASWSATNADWLAPYLYMIKADAIPGLVYDRDYYYNGQLNTLVNSALFSYIGGPQHTHFLAFNNGFTGKFGRDIGVPPPYDEYPLFAPMLFRADGGSTSYTRVAWPCDEWYRIPGQGDNDFVSIPVDGFRLLGFPALTSTAVQLAQWSFGEGCWAIAMSKRETEKDPFEVHFMFTRDFGSSWQFSPAIPNEWLPKYQWIDEKIYSTFPTLLMIKPYTDEKKKGRILMASQDFEANKLVLYVTDGDFQQFKRAMKLGVIGTLGYSYIAPVGYTFVNFGNEDVKPYIWPAHPGVMEPEP